MKGDVLNGTGFGGYAGMLMGEENAQRFVNADSMAYKQRLGLCECLGRQDRRSREYRQKLTSLGYHNNLQK